MTILPHNFILLSCSVVALGTIPFANGAEQPNPKEKPQARILNAVYSRPAGQGNGIPAKLIGDSYYHPRSPYSYSSPRSYSTYSPSPYRYQPAYERFDYGQPNFYSNDVGNEIVDGDFGDRGSWYQSRSYGYTSRYPFSSTQVPAYRYPFSREYYSYGPGYSNYGYAFGYPYGWYGGWHPGWYGGFGYWAPGYWGGPWFPYHPW